MKDVAAHVGVSSTLIHYHFKGKESIYEAIWARKAPISVHNRLEAMRLYAEKVGDDITVEGALHAWIDADLNVQIVDQAQWAAFGKIARSEEHTSELQSLMRISYAVFCLKKQKRTHNKIKQD